MNQRDNQLAPLRMSGGPLQSIAPSNIKMEDGQAQPSKALRSVNGLEMLLDAGMGKERGRE